MSPRARNLAGCALAVVLMATSGYGVASALQDAPQDARPADPVGDLMRNPAPPAATETPPAGAPAPVAPIVVTPLPEDAPLAPVLVPEAPAEEDEVAAAETVAPPPEAPAKPERRQRRRVAVIQAIDKITAETMRFEVEVGGRPVRFDKSLIFTARACEVSGANEQVDDSVAYVEVTLQPRPGVQNAQARQIFRGWMFASAPSVSGLQHPLYDAWVVGCKA